MTITQLNYFNLVCKMGSITSAAEEMHVSQPSISNAIKQLEYELGVQLFYRVKMRLVLTDAGEYFYAESEKLLKSFDLLSTHMQSFNDQHSIVKLGIPAMVGLMLFPTVFHEFRENYPDIRMESLEAGTLECWDRISDGSLDIAITILNDIDIAKFCVVPLMETELVFCYRKGELPYSGIISAKDIQYIPVIMQQKGCYNERIVNKFYGVDNCDPHILLRSSQISTTIQLVEQGGVGAFLFDDIVNSNMIEKYRFLPELTKFTIGLVWENNKRLSKDALTFINFIKGFHNLSK